MTIRIGLVGCGNISDTHARAAREVPDVELVAYWGHDPAKASAMAAPLASVRSGSGSAWPSSWKRLTISQKRSAVFSAS